MVEVKQYRINEIFYSLQGEGAWAGVPMVFVRFSGCNLQCPFCDTQHEDFRLMTSQDIRNEISQYPCQRVCLTGGEPTLQVTEGLISSAFQGYQVHMETNGSQPIPQGVDWVTVSPKVAQVVVDKCQEIKLLFGEGSDDPQRWASFDAEVFCLQPIDVAGDAEATQRNVAQAIDYCKSHPQWRLSLQTHKITHIR